MENDIKNEEELEQEITYPISISIDMEKSFSYAYYHTDARLKIDNYSKNTSYSFIRSITIKNDYDKSFKDLKLKFIFSHDAFSTYDININSIGINEEKDISVPFIIVKKELLDSINEPMPAFLKLVIYDKDNNILSEIENGFNILPVSQLLIDCFDNRLFAKFVTPECQIVKQITVDASNILNRSLIAYQNKDKNKILEEVEAIYKAIHNYGITYQVAPSKRAEIQRVRMPYEVLTDRKGNCLDLSILFAACLEEVGYNPILQFGETHALAGFFLDDVEDSTDSEITTASFPHGIEKRDYVIRNLFGSKILIFDAVCVVADKNISFQGAIDCGKDYVMTNYGPEFMAVDVKTCHLNAFSPIPSVGNSDSTIEKINPQTLIDRQVEEISNDKYVNVLKPEEKSRFTFWERKLLDLSEANPLVNFKPDSKRTVRLISENPIHEAIFNNDVMEISTSFITKNGKKTDGDSGLSGQSFDYLVNHPDTKPSHFNPIINNKDLLYAVGYEKTFDELIKKSNASMEETGAQTLYICFGILTYKRKNGEVGQAPFGILPIEKLTKSKAGGKYYVSFDSNEFMINQTFFEYYKNEHQGIDFSELYSCNILDGYMNIVNTFKSNSDIRLEEKAVFICNLTFSHYIMWQDIRKRQDILKENKVVESIIQNRNLLNETPSYDGQSIDDIEKYADFAAPLPYDSTQLMAILESGNGKSFILDGPPGTGKSQTIVNMIVNAFYHGKTVLFVAEKKAALDVVYDRLEKIKLGRFALELHSNKANKDNFYNKLNESMELGTTIAPFDFNINCIDLEAKRDKLRSIINSMKENKYLYSLYDSIVLYENLKQEGYEYSIKLDKDYLKSLTKDTYNEINVLIDKLIALSKSINDYENNPLRFISLKELRFSNRNEILNDFNAVNKLFIEFDKAYNDFMARFNIDIKYKNINIDSLINSLNIL
ncbi:MAG: DUF4011 domain-containing protein, partial [Acholeplasmatales bacterium]|nr:DUF4011 domain-containing protein [Acholeplasmatales bacterium]